MEAGCAFLEFELPSDHSESLLLCALLWPHDGQNDQMAAWQIRAGQPWRPSDGVVARTELIRIDQLAVIRLDFMST